jgi:heme A synthase
MTQALASVHSFGARALLVFALVLGVWGTYAYFRDRPLGGGFRSSYLIMAALTVVQGLIGAGTFALGDRPTEILHVVYGAFAVLFLPGAYVYAHGGSRRRETLILGGAAWIVSIAYFRGIATG